MKKCLSFLLLSSAGFIQIHSVHVTHKSNETRVLLDEISTELKDLNARFTELEQEDDAQEKDIEIQKIISKIHDLVKKAQKNIHLDQNHAIWHDLKNVFNRAIEHLGWTHENTQGILPDEAQDED